jgi:hypothetical protein
MMQSGSAAGDLWSEATVLPLALMGPLELVGFLFVYGLTVRGCYFFSIKLNK